MRNRKRGGRGHGGRKYAPSVRAACIAQNGIDPQASTEGIALGFSLMNMVKKGDLDVKRKVNHSGPGSEFALQCACARYMKTKWPHVLAWHTPNGARLRQGTANRMKAAGVLPGVPDWTIISPGGHVFFVELKREGGGSLSKEQRAFRDSLPGNVPWHLATTLDEFIAITDKELDL